MFSSTRGNATAYVIILDISVHSFHSSSVSPGRPSCIGYFCVWECALELASQSRLSGLVYGSFGPLAPFSQRGHWPCRAGLRLESELGETETQRARTLCSQCPGNCNKVPQGQGERSEDLGRGTGGDWKGLASVGSMPKKVCNVSRHVITHVQVVCAGPPSSHPTPDS